MTDFQVGDLVTGIYKTGKYIGEITDIRPQHYLIRVLGVLKHPMQGDLHNPKNSDVLIFHERKALAFREQANIPKQMVKRYTGNIPDYGETLNTALDSIKKELKEASSAWAEQSLKNIESLEKDYYLKK